MKSQDIEMTRSELYNLVWNEPMIHLSKRFGLSDNGLRKICNRHDIPTPSAGYWARKQHGWKVKQKPLPVRTNEFSEQVIFLTVKDHLEKHNVDEDLNNLLPGSFLSKSAHVPLRIKKYHPLVQTTKKSLESDVPDDYRAVRSREGISVRVSPKSITRAIRILNALLNIMSDYEIRIDQGTYFIIEGEKVYFYMYEQMKQINHVKSKDEEKYSYYHRRWAYLSTGQLKLCIGKTISADNKGVSDGKRYSLEERLGDFIKALGKEAYLIRRNRLER